MKFIKLRFEFDIRCAHKSNIAEWERFYIEEDYCEKYIVLT